MSPLGSMATTVRPDQTLLDPNIQDKQWQSLIEQDRQCTYDVTMRHFSATTVGSETTVLHTLSVCL